MASVLLDRQRRIRGFPPLRAIAIPVALALQVSFPLFAQDRLLPVFYFRQVNGLISDEIRSNAVRDRDGFVWVGTLTGLNRYDGYSAKEYRNDPNDPHSISSNVVHGLCVDRKGRLWVGTHDSGLSLYDPLHDNFINFIPHAGDPSWYDSRCIANLSEDRSGNIWMGTMVGGVVRAKLPEGDIDNLDSLVRWIHFTTYPLGTRKNTALSLVEREDGQILIGSDSGLIILDPVTNVMSRLHLPTRLGRRLDSLAIQNITQDSQGTLWVGTESEGLFRIAKNSSSVENFRHREGDVSSLKSDVIWGIAEDHQGNLWIGSKAGVDLFSPSTGQCIPFLTIGSTPRWPVGWMYLTASRDGILWIATPSEGLYRLSPKSSRFPLFGLQDNDGTSPISFVSVDRDQAGAYWFMSSAGVLHEISLHTRQVIRRIDVLRGQKLPYDMTSSVIDRQGIYWFGTYGLGLFRVDLRTGQTSNFGVKAGLFPPRVAQSIAEGEGDTLWVAAYWDGVMKFNASTGRFIKVASLPAEDMFSVMKDRQGKIWISSERNGITILDPTTGATEQFRHVPSDPRSLGSDHVRYTYEDPSGQVWAGAGNEINLWDPKAHSFIHYINPAFKRSQFADPLGSDKKGRLWIRYMGNGVAVLDPSSGSFTSFDITDGIGGFRTMLNLPDGRVLLPHWLGVNIFHPDSVDVQCAPPSLVITAMSINNEQAVVPWPVTTFTPLRLDHSQNVLEFEFAAIDIDAPDFVEYQYMLEGLEKEWVRPKDRRFVRYPSLPPGDYVFRVRAASSRGEWPEQEIALVISVAPPWWRTAWAYAAYAFVLAAFLFAGYRLRLRQIQLKQAAVMEHFHAEHLAEVDRLKSRFFSNISHEFRTPLTLILGSADQTLDATDVGRKDQKVHLIKQNARKLLALVNQLLDLSRVESGMIRLQVSGGDLVQFLRRVVMSFESWAERKKINLEFCPEVESADGFFDGDKLEKIVNNLMSNAVKFTPEGGRIRVQVSPSPPRPLTKLNERESGRGGEKMTITITDTGPGISSEHLHHIFDRFYRVDETHTTEGTGIGLALTKELVELHHGTIAVESTPGKGSVFTVVLPIEKEEYKTEEVTETVAGHEEERPIEAGPLPGEPKAVPTVSAVNGMPNVLVVEDNADLRVYIREYLENDYVVQEAENGKVGYDRAVETTPDLVISDVMMPEMDGMELCRSLKQDVRTSHVPVILLTARAGTESKIEGLEIGADDYVTKPFDAKELLARVRNLIEQRRQLRAKFSAGVVLKPGEVAVTSLDDALLKKVMEAVEKNIGNEDFGVDDLAREACLSRTHLNHKLHALTNLSTVEFIRYIRLQRAHELLEKNAGTIAEISYQVGFGSPSYFGSCFRERFGYPPSEVLHKQPS